MRNSVHVERRETTRNEKQQIEIPFPIFKSLMTFPLLENYLETNTVGRGEPALPGSGVPGS